MSGFPGDFHVAFSNGKIEKYKRSFKIEANGVLHVVSTAHDGRHFWFSPTGWLSIEKMTAP
jgi:hypothetical protein